MRQHTYVLRPSQDIAANAIFLQGLKKTIPGAPENQVPVHLRPKQVYAQFPGRQY